MACSCSSACRMRWHQVLDPTYLRRDLVQQGVQLQAGNINRDPIDQHHIGPCIQTWLSVIITNSWARCKCRLRHPQCSGWSQLGWPLMWNQYCFHGHELHKFNHAADLMHGCRLLQCVIGSICVMNGDYTYLKGPKSTLVGCKTIRAVSHVCNLTQCTKPHQPLA